MKTILSCSHVYIQTHGHTITHTYTQWQEHIECKYFNWVYKRIQCQNTSHNVTSLHSEFLVAIVFLTLLCNNEDNASISYCSLLFLKNLFLLDVEWPCFRGAQCPLAYGTQRLYVLPLQLRIHDQLYLLSLLSELMLLHMHYVEENIHRKKTACCDAVIELKCFLYIYYYLFLMVSC